MKKTALYDMHKNANAKMVSFNGFALPVWYQSLKQEHLAVRNNAGMFDISHMGAFQVSGDGAFELLQTLICNDIAKTHNGNKMIYGMVLNEDGGILDDVFVGCLKAQTYILVVNAGNKDKILDWISEHQKGSVTIQDLGSDHGFIAVQGPNAIRQVEQVLGTQMDCYPRFSVFETNLFGANCIAMRTGYTGEDGVELLIPKTVINQCWALLVSKGVQLCGLGARDSLRIEAGLPLYGQELSEELNPLMTRYPWVVAWNTDFIGKKALTLIKQTGPRYKSVGFVMSERVIPRQGYPIIDGGYVTSGTLSPYLDTPIGLGFVPISNAVVGECINIEIRNKTVPAEIVSLPFHHKKET